MVFNIVKNGLDAAGTQLNDTLFGAPIRLGVTGLARSGKTVFITSLVTNLLEQGQMPQLKALAQGRVLAAFLQPQPDDTIARFPFEHNLAQLNATEPVWPDNTKTISQLRLSLKLSQSGLMSAISSSTTRHLDIFDYPGEWILDLALMHKSYADWSKETLERLSTRSVAKEYLDAVGTYDPLADFDELVAQSLARSYCAYLEQARKEGYSDLTPGRFLLPGDMQGSPALTFAPLPPAKSHGRRSLYREMQRRYEAYKSRVVQPFFRDHFAQVDRQIVLVDVLGALHKGPRAIEDLRRTMTDILQAFRPGTNSTLGRLLRGARVDRLVFAATKADHLHHSLHPNLTALMQALTDDAARRARFNGAKTLATSIASVRSTVEDTRTLSGEIIDCVRGTTLDTRKQVAFYAGDLPKDPQDILGQIGNSTEKWLNADYGTVQFAPPARALRHNQGIAHIRLDQVAEFLMGDQL